MANTTLTQTGAQVQSILNKADKLPATVGTNGQVLTSDGTNLSWTTPQGGGGGGTQLYKHIVNNKYIFVGLSPNQYTNFVSIMNDIIISIVSYAETPFVPFNHMYIYSTDGATFTLCNLDYDSNQMKYETISSITSDIVTPL